MPINEKNMGEERVEAMLDRLSRIRNTDVENLRSRVERSVGRIEARRGRVRVLRYASTIAASLLLVGGILFFMGRETDDTHIERIAEQVVLTISDGSRVEFDEDTDNDTLAVYDNVAMIIRDGQLVYENRADAQAADPGFATLRVPKGKRFDMVLADGTHVWLNADSHIRFPLNFAGDERRVSLEGEAWFEVAHDGGKTFVVETEGQVLRVLGTKFNISAYADRKIVRTALVEGSVALEAEGGAKITLTPGREARLDRTAAAAKYVDGPVRGDVSAWRNDLFLTDGDRLEDVFVKLSRWYDVEYTFADRKAADLVLRGNLPMYDDIAAVLELIEISGQVTLDTRGKNVKIRMK